MSDAATKTATGTLAGITEKPTGWTTISVSRPGQEYPLKLDTKKQELVELARAAGTDEMEWTYTESDSGTPNPNRPGTNYLNRRFEGVAPVGTSGVATPEAGTQAQPGLVGAVKDRSIVRQVCIKAAAELEAGQGPLPAPPDYDAPLEVMKAAARFEQWIYRDVDELPFE